MSRALRRHPAVSKPSKKGASIRATRPPKGGGPTQGRRGWRRFLPRWIDDIVSELRKVTWPTRNETVNLTLVVVVVSAAVGGLLGGIDIFFNWFMTNTILR
ncbi:MAG TPA: preprotein translocase subunit SecE [Dehalococcoidia bacterium]|nr:preprotein translocase subunit SecE [Dehalococcoidia bacterium]